jgi:hypothetical protein
MSLWVKDTVERALATWLQTSLALLLAAGPLDALTLSTVRAVALGGLAAALAVVKAALASRFNPSVSPASFAPGG